MSASHDASTSSAHAVHADHHHAHAFDGEPVKVLPPDEPRTPGWVPLLGVLLFVVGGVAVLLSGDDASPGATPEKTSAEARPSPQAAEARPPAAQPPGGTPPALQRLSPEAMKAAQQRLDEARARQAAQAAQQGGEPAAPQPAAPGAQPGQAQPGRPQPGQPQRNVIRPIEDAPARRPAPAPAPGGAAQ